MDNEQVQQQIQELKGQVQHLIELINHENNTPSQLDRYINQETKDVINKTYQETYKQVSVLVGAAFTIYPQSKYIKLSGTASRTSSTTLAITNGTWIGQPLIIEGTDNTNTIIIKDTANTQLAGDCTLGIYDTLSLMWNGTYWIEQCRSNN